MPLVTSLTFNEKSDDEHGMEFVSTNFHFIGPKYIIFFTSEMIAETDHPGYMRSKYIHFRSARRVDRTWLLMYVMYVEL